MKKNVETYSVERKESKLVLKGAFLRPLGIDYERMLRYEKNTPTIKVPDQEITRFETWSVRKENFLEVGRTLVEAKLDLVFKVHKSKQQEFPVERAYCELNFGNFRDCLNVVQVEMNIIDSNWASYTLRCFVMGISVSEGS